MSYRDTVSKLQRVLSKVESLSSDFIIEMNTYVAARKKAIDELSKEWEKRSIAPWSFKLDNWGYRKFANGSQVKLICEGTSSLSFGGLDSMSRGIAMRKLVLSGNYESFKEEIVERLLVCINNGVKADLFTLSKNILDPAKMIEDSITPDFYNYLHDFYTTAKEGYEELLNMWYSPSASLEEYIDAANNLIDQASEEWVTERIIKVGDICDTNPEQRVTAIIGDTFEATGQYRHADRFDDYTGERRRDAWIANNPELRIAELLSPTAGLKSYVR